MDRLEKMMTLSPDKIIEVLELEPLPVEGGLFRQTYISSESIQKAHLPHRCTSCQRMKSGISIWGIRLSCLSSTLMGRVKSLFSDMRSRKGRWFSTLFPLESGRDLELLKVASSPYLVQPCRLDLCQMITSVATEWNSLRGIRIM